ncbi:hypothetical protein ONA70_31565 [Micromonospora yasonensis]|uniref:hypothetical protein n=1 Tax=Micromonospora yasonensis TaxID=1128667 RepID=UPI002231D957|nr:hypothetical protein [Micromonospora yasonensis]MCW3844626.1 hypothetical protein [Micromonospora yasonensis]
MLVGWHPAGGRGHRYTGGADATWPVDHQQRVDGFLTALPDVPALRYTTLAWALGLVIGARTKV